MAKIHNCGFEVSPDLALSDFDFFPNFSLNTFRRNEIFIKDVQVAVKEYFESLEESFFNPLRSPGVQRTPDI